MLADIISDRPLGMENFHNLLLVHLKEINLTILKRFSRGNITYAISDLEFVIPVRRIIEEKETQLFVILGTKIERDDKFFRIKIRPKLEVNEI